MKKVTLLLIIVMLLAMPLFAQKQEQVRKFHPLKVKPKMEFVRYDTIYPPDWNLFVEPTVLLTTYYNYLPGNYCSYPIRIQHGDGPQEGGGKYLIFHARPTQTDNRRVYWAYVQSNDITINGPGTVTGYDNWQGYAGVDMINNFSDNPVVCWHEDYDGDTYFETPVTYDDFDLLGIPGFWQDVYPIDNPNAPYDEYIWPYVYSGPSPLGDDYTRIYILRSNYALNSFAHPCENVEIRYKDIQSANEINTAGWDNLVDPPMFTDWREYDIRPFQSFTIDQNTPGRLAFVGYAVYLTPEAVPTPPPVEEGLFIYESLDYGETWTLYELGFPPKIENIPNFEFNGYCPDSLDVGCIGYHNSAIFDSNGNLHWCYLGSYGIPIEGGYYYLDGFLDQREFVWFGGDEVEHRNVWPQCPWEVDPATGDTVLHYSHCVPMSDMTQNLQRQAVDLEDDLMIQVWADGTYQMFAQWGIPGYEEYLDHPLIYISASNDNGQHWTEPIRVSDITNPIFEDQKTLYPYIADEIVDVSNQYPGGDWRRVYMYYYDDRTIGPWTPWGYLNYMAIDIDFDWWWIPPPPPYYVYLFPEWNWISFYVHPSDTSIESVFSSVEGHVYQVKNQTQSATYYNGIWIGDLTHITDGEGYLVYSYDTVELIVWDWNMYLIPPDTPIYLNEDWNWIAYFPQNYLSIEDALESIEPNGYQIKNQTQSAIYFYPPGVWVGNLTQMEPTVGYKLNMVAPDILIYPFPYDKSQQFVVDNITNNPLNWQLMSGTQYNMVVIAKVDAEDRMQNAEHSIGIFDDEGNCRSIGVEQNLKGDSFWYFTIVGNEEKDEQKELYFKLYDKESDKTYISNETILFADNTTLGSPDEPIKIAFKSEPTDQTIPYVFELEQNYPNPFNPETKIEYQLPRDTQVEISIYNIRGEKVKTLVNDKENAGHHSVIWNGTDDRNRELSSGIYLYRIKIDGYCATKKMLLVK